MILRANDVRFAISSGVAFETDGFHLQNGSNAIGRGRQSLAPPEDIDGEARPQGSGVDIGADEAPPAYEATPQSYLTQVPAVSITPELCMQYHIEPGSAPVVSLALWYRKNGAEWQFYGTFTDLGAPVCFDASATGDGAYEFCLVATDDQGRCEVRQSFADARTVIATSFPDGRVYVDNQSTEGLRNGASWEDAFQSIADGILAAQLAGITDVWVAGGYYHEKISIPSGVKVQGGYDPINNEQKWKTTLFPPAPDPIWVMVGYGSSKSDIGNGFTPTVTMTEADSYQQLSNAELSGFIVYPSSLEFYGADFGHYDIALKISNATPSTRISDCVFEGRHFLEYYDKSNGIRCMDASPTLTNCAFEGFTQGVAVNGSSAPVMNDCHWGKTALAYLFGYSVTLGYGLGVGDEAQVELNRCTFESRVSAGGESQIEINDSDIGACSLVGESAGTVKRCIFTGGMRVDGSASADISNSILSIDINSNNQANLITDCAIQGSAGSGICCWEGSYAEFRNCIIAGNGLSANDSAIECSACSPVFRNCTVADNAGTAVKIQRPYIEHKEEAHPAFLNCIISDHHGSGSAGISCYRNVNVNEGIGGAPVLKDGLPVLTNCLFYGNDGGDLLVHDGSDENVTRVYEALDINTVTGSTSTVCGDPKFVRGLSGTWDNINWVFGKELALEAAGPYVEVPDLTGRFLVANNQYARQIRILDSPFNPNHNTMQIQCEYVLSLEDGGTIGTYQGDDVYHGGGVHTGDAFHVVDYHLQDGSMAVDGADASVAPGTDAEGRQRPSGPGAQVSIGAYEAPASYVAGPQRPYTRVTELEGAVEGVIVGLNFNVRYVAHSIDTNPVAEVELWYQFNGGVWTLYQSVDSTETPISFNADQTGPDATQTGPGMYGFYTVGIAADGTREDPPFVPDAKCEVAAPWDGVTPICVAFDAASDEGCKKTGVGWGNAFQKLSNAIARARVYHIGEIWVKMGSYDPITMISDIAIYGGFAGTETARDGRDSTANTTTIKNTEMDWVGTDMDGMKTPRSVRFAGTHNTLLDGLTMSLGVIASQCDATNKIQNCTVKNYVGVSVILDDSSTEFSHCSITSDTGTYFWRYEEGPFTVTGEWYGISMCGGSPSFTDCQVDGVFWSAVCVDAGATPTFADCRILSRQPDPSGDAHYESSGFHGMSMKSVVSCFCNAAPEFRSCTIAGCAEVGVYVSQWPDGECPETDGRQNLVPVFDDCTISVSGMTPWMSHLRKDGYGIVCMEAATTPQFSHCRIQGNYVGVYTYDSRADFSNCIIANNGSSYTDGAYAYLEGAGIYCNGSPASTFINCTITDNPNVAVETHGWETPLLTNCIITGTDGAEAVRHRCPATTPPALKNCYFNNRLADYGAYDNHGVLSTAHGAAELAQVSGITSPVDGAPHFMPSQEIGWLGAVPESVRENGYTILSMTDKDTYTQFTAPPDSFPADNALAGSFILAVSNDGRLYAKAGLIVANTDTTIDVMGDFTERQPATLQVVIPNYHIGDGSRALWHGTVDGAPVDDIDGDTRPGTDTYVDIGADEGMPGSRPDNVHLLHLLCPNGGQTLPQSGTSFHEAGTTVPLSAADTTDRAFVRWEELDAAGQVIAEHNQSGIQVQMNADRTFRAIFGARLAITVEKRGVGGVAPLTGTYNYIEFTQAAFAASPVEGSQFAYWEDASGLLLGTAPVLSFTVTESVTVRAVFIETGAVCAPPVP